MNYSILKQKISPADKLVLLYIIDNSMWDQFNQRSAEIGKNLSMTRNQVLQSLENLQVAGFITTTKNGLARVRKTIITPKTKQLING